MKIRDLIERLKELEEEHGSDIEVKVYDTQATYYKEPLMIEPMLAKQSQYDSNIMLSKEWTSLSNIRKSKNCKIIGIK